MSDPIKIEPYYQAQAKEIVDCLFDKAYFSETLNRNGMDDVEGLLAYYLQTASETAARCGAMTKKYKATAKRRQEDEDHARHEEEIRWIARAREAEHEVLRQRTEILAQQERIEELEKLWEREEQAEKAWKWGREVGVFLKETLSPPFLFEMGAASRLFTDGIALGIIPEPDCRPGKIICTICHQPFDNYHSNRCPGISPDYFEGEIKPGDGCPCPPDLTEICPKCGGRKI